jgi:hypothetical protein
MFSEHCSFCSKVNGNLDLLNIRPKGGKEGECCTFVIVDVFPFLCCLIFMSDSRFR